MAYTLGDYQNEDVRQQTIDLLNNLSQTPGVGGGISIIPIEYIQTIGRSTGPGSIAKGKNSISILNDGDANGTVDGVNLLPGETVNFAAPLNGTLDIMAFDATGTEFLITYIEPA